MQDTNECKKEELQGKLKELEEKQEELDYHAKQIFREEEEEDFEMSCTYTAIERMRGRCSLEDRVEVNEEQLLWWEIRSVR